MAIPHIDPNREATYDIKLGSTFDDIPRRSLHALKYNFKPAAMDYSKPGNLTSTDDGSGDVSLTLPSTTDGEFHTFKGPMQEAKANEFVLVYDPESNNFVLERLASMTRLNVNRSSRTNTLNGGPLSSQTSSIVERPPDASRQRSVSSDDIPTISLDPPTSSGIEPESMDIDDPTPIPSLVTPRLPPVSPTQPRHVEESESFDDDSDIIEIPNSTRAAQSLNKTNLDDDVSDEDLDDLANELESSLENRPGSSSSDVDSDAPRPPKVSAPNFSNVPRSGGPISMSRFAGGRRREEEESSSSSDDDD